MIHCSAIRALALSTAMLSASFGTAFAQDASAVGERLKAVLSTQGAELSWTGISGDASEMVIEGAAIGVPGAKGKAELGDVVLTDITDNDGGYLIGNVALPDYSVSEDGAAIDATGIEIAGLRIPPEGSTDPLGSLMLYDSADLENLTVKIGDTKVFAMDQLHVEISTPAEDKAMEFSGSAEKFSADLSLVDDPESRKVIDAMGYNTIEGYFETSGTWQTSDGRLELAQYDITVENAGTFGMTFDVTGYTPDFIKSLQAMQKQLAANSDGADNSAQGLAMLGLMQQLTFNSLSFRLDDDSLTGKILDYVAAKQGMKAADIANQAKAILPFVLAQLNNPDLTAQATAAVSAYLDNPKSIEISAKPEKPVPFAVIMAGAMSSTPQDLVKTLGVAVTANED